MHKINQVLDMNEEKLPCDSGCKHYRFDHLDCACVLSEVYSVKKGEMCAIYAEQAIKNPLDK